jgi:hypothetical protein
VKRRSRSARAPGPPRSTRPRCLRSRTQSRREVSKSQGLKVSGSHDLSLETLRL